MPFMVKLGTRVPLELPALGPVRAQITPVGLCSLDTTLGSVRRCGTFGVAVADTHAGLVTQPQRWYQSSSDVASR